MKVHAEISISRLTAFFRKPCLLCSYTRKLKSHPSKNRNDLYVTASLLFKLVLIQSLNIV